MCIKDGSVCFLFRKANGAQKQEQITLQEEFKEVHFSR